MPDELGWILQDLAQKRAVDFGSSAVEANIPETRTFLSCSHPSFAETWCKNAVFKKKKVKEGSLQEHCNYLHLLVPPPCITRKGLFHELLNDL